jgi:hypothetical protein
MWEIALEEHAMKRRALVALVALAAANAGAVALTALQATAAPPTKTNASASTTADAPVVQSLAGFLEKELRWGMTHQTVTEAYNGKSDGSSTTTGLFDQDYAPILNKTPVGPKYDNLLNDLKNRKTAFAKSYTEFKADPTGYDATAIKDEYTYNNSEALMRVQRGGKLRYMFFIQDKLWKVYDEIPLKADGTLGTTYQEAVAKLQAALNVAPRTTPGTADWQDATSLIRVVDRGANVVAVLLIDKSTHNRIDSLRKNKAPDPFALDPSVAAITKNGVSDPNANNKPAPSASASAGKKPPPKK